jgi:haloalkane dehalogenase
MRSPKLAPSPTDHLPAAFAEMPGRSEWFTWHANRIHYRRLGAGLPVVLVHMVDIGASCIEWRRNLAPLSEDFDTYAVDLPGFGLSGVPEETPRAEFYNRFLFDFLTHLRSDHADIAPCVIGSGDGAAYLAWVARTHPGLIKRMVLVAPAGVSACKPNRLGAVAFQALRLPIVSSFAASSASRTGILEHLKQDIYGDDGCAGMNEAEARYYVAHKPGVEAVERARLAGLLHVDLKPHLSEITTPTMLMWGRKAVCPPAEDAEVWRDLNQVTRVSLFEQSGLCPHFEEPARFNDLVKQYLEVEKLAQAA